MATHTNPTVWQLTVIGPSGETVLVDWLFDDLDRAADAAVQQMGNTLHLPILTRFEDEHGEALLRKYGFEFTDTTGWMWTNLDDIGDDAVILKERDIL